MLTQGWIKLHRSIQESVVFDNGEPYTRRDAWIWILLNANMKDATFYRGFEKVDVHRGQIVVSVRKLSSAWNRSLAWCMKTIELFVANGMLEKLRTPCGTLLTVVNYGLYQDSDTELRTQNGTLSEHPVEHLANAEWNRSKKDKKDIRKKKKDKEVDVCTEPSQVSAPPVMQFILNDKTMFPITQEDIEHYRELYPAVNVEQELRKLCGWCEGNPSKRKTRGGAPRFIHSWLAREQDRGGNGGKPQATVYQKPRKDDYEQRPNEEHDLEAVPEWLVRYRQEHGEVN